MDGAFNAANGDAVRTSTFTFTDTTEVTAIAAPTFTDGPGDADYYTLPNVPGVTWTVTGDPAYGGGRTIQPTEIGLLGTPLKVGASTATSPFTVTVTASAANGYTLKAGLTPTTWTQKFDSRVSVTPAAPSFLDATGLANDQVTFPALGAGITKYTYQVSGGAVTDVDGSWYGKTVSSMNDLKNTTSPYKVTINAVLASGVIATANADGTSAPTSWNYSFTNLINVVPTAPTAVPAANGGGTLTFPVDTKVTYTVVANGISKTVPVSDLGKPLTYTGPVTVKVTAASGYLVQPNADGTAPADWQFFGASQGPGGAPTVTNTVLANGWQASVAWAPASDAVAPVSYTVTFQKVAEKGSPVANAPVSTWYTTTTATSGTFNAGPDVTYRVSVVSTDSKGTKSQVGTTDIAFPKSPGGVDTTGWVDINTGTGQISGYDNSGAKGWSGLYTSAYFNNTVLTTYASGASWTTTVSGKLKMDIYGTLLTNGSKALIQVDGVNWAYLDSAATNAPNPYRQLLRSFNLPDAKAHTVKIINLSANANQQLALDAYKLY